MLSSFFKKTVKNYLNSKGYELYRKYYYDFNADNTLVKLVDTKFSDRKELIIFDVGANVGQSVERFYKIFPKANIYSFEPNLTVFEQLKKKEQKYPNFKAHNKGLSDKIEKRAFYKQPDSGSSSFLKLNVEGEEFTLSNTEEAKQNHNKTTIKENLSYNTEVFLETDTLDNYCKENSITEIDILKIDTQGFETEVLNGAKEMLSNISMIECEIIMGQSYEKTSSFYQIESLIRDYGFELWDIPYIAKFATDDLSRINFVDALFVNKNRIK